MAETQRRLASVVQPCRVPLEPIVELTCDDEPIVYCLVCWQREFGEG